MNVLQLLKNDHSAVKSLFNEFDKVGRTSPDQKVHLFDRIRRELQIHSQAEQEIFYPAIKALNGNASRNLISEALAEHREIEQLLTELARLKPTDKNFGEKMETLIESVDHHVGEEEGEIFRFAEENCSTEQLDDLASQLEERKKTIDRQLAA